MELHSGCSLTATTRSSSTEALLLFPSAKRWSTLRVPPATPRSVRLVVPRRTHFSVAWPRPSSSSASNRHALGARFAPFLAARPHCTSQSTAMAQGRWTQVDDKSTFPLPLPVSSTFLRVRSAVLSRYPDQLKPAIPHAVVARGNAGLGFLGRLIPHRVSQGA